MSTPPSPPPEHVEHCRECKGQRVYRENAGYNDGTRTVTPCFMCNGTGRQSVLVWGAAE